MSQDSSSAAGPARFRPPGPLGCGGAPLGNLFAPVSDDEAASVLEAAWDAGVRHYDTAPFYGFGLSERRVGNALRGRARGDYTLSTKVGRLLDATAGPVARERFSYVDALPFDPRFDYGADAAQRSIEASLERLGLDRIDIVYIHDVGEDTHGPEWTGRLDEAMDGAAVALTRLREEGVIRGWGLGVNRVAPCLAALDRSDPDVMLLAGRYTLLDNEDALETLLPRCLERGVAIVVGGPYNSGLLAGADTFDYARAAPDLVARRDAMRAICARHGVDLRAAALQFCAAHPAVAAVIPGARTADEMRTNARLMAVSIPFAVWGELKLAELIPPGAPVPLPRGL